MRSRAPRETSPGARCFDPQAHPGEPDAVDEEPEDGGQRRSRRAHSDGGEHLVQDLFALVDAPAVEELLGGGATELHFLVDGRVLGRVEEGARRLLEPPAEAEHLGEAHAQASQSGRRRGSVLEGETEEARGLVERELGGGLLGGAFGETRGALEVARAEPVHGDGLGVGPGRVPSSDCASRPWYVRSVASGICATIVSRIRSWVASTTSRPSRSPVRTKPPRAEKSDELVDRVLDAGRGRDDRDGEGPAADGHDLDEPPGGFGQALQALGDHLIEGQHRQGRAGRGGRAAIASHELFDEKRAAARFARHGARRSLRELVGCVEESEHEPVRLVRHRAAPPGRRALRIPSGHRSRISFRKALVSASSSRYVITSRIGGAPGGRSRSSSKRGAVDVPPVRVVDEEHERLPRREPREQTRAGRRTLADGLLADRRWARSGAGRSCRRAGGPGIGEPAATRPRGGRRARRPPSMRSRWRLSASMTVSTAL